MEKINIAEILKDCPQGTKLYSPMCGECTLDSVDGLQYAITVRAADDRLPYYLTADGRYLDVVDAECVLFPSKDQRDWSKFQRPFKDGDVLITGNGRINECAAIFKEDKSYYGNEGFIYYALTSLHSEKQIFKTNDWSCNINIRLATEEEKQQLFQVIKENGYKWNEKTKTLEKLPKFKVGDRIKGKYTNNIYTISNITSREYWLTNGQTFSFDDEDCYELVPNKFNINTLKAFDKVLVRNTNNGRWRGQFYMSYDKNEEYPFECTYNCWKQCIPYEGNEHLHDKTDDCDEYYKTWE